MPEKGRTAIIAMGGGMRSAHGAGFLYALATELGITAPDIVVATSGNAGNSMYYVTGQYEFARKVWSGVLSTPKFISLWRFWRIMDIDYLIDTVIKKELPLDAEALEHSAIEYFIPVAEAETGKIRYIGKADRIDIFEVLRAAKAILILFGKRVSLQGKQYMDGEMGATLSDHVEFAVSQGAINILVINNTGKWKGLKKLAMELYTLRLSKELRNVILKDINEFSVCMVADGATILCVSPGDLPAGILTRDKTKLLATFERGEADALALEPELRTLFNTYV